jgi:hypothetical protein
MRGMQGGINDMNRGVKILKLGHCPKAGGAKKSWVNFVDRNA